MRKRANEKPFPGAGLLAAAAAMGLLIAYADAAKAGMAEALALCGRVMVPSLFPLLVVSRFAASCRCPAKLQELCAGPLRALFGLSPGCLAPLLLGLTGGYPLAAKTAAAAENEGRITAEDARRLTLFFTCPGIPFSVTVAGGRFRSGAIGWTLLASCVCADMLAAFIAHRLSRRPAEIPRRAAGAPGRPLAEVLVLSVDGAVKAMLSVCAWIAAFGTCLSVLRAATGGRGAAALALTAEVTAALETAAGRNDAPLTAACLAFGGLCVCCQLLPELRACGARARRFPAVRLACAGIAYLTETALLRLLRIPVPTETRLGGVYLAANSAAGSAALLFLCAVFMGETSRKRDFP